MCVTNNNRSKVKETKMLDLEKLMECVTEFDKARKTTKKENMELAERQEETRQQKLEELFEFLKPYNDVARKVSNRIYVEPFIKIGCWTYGITIDSHHGKYEYGIYHYMDNDDYWEGYIAKKQGQLNFKEIANETFSSDDSLEKYIDGILLHKDVFEEKFAEAIQKSMLTQTQELEKRRKELLKGME